ncbi:MAG: NADH-quinone oxidoreductase subunit J family protein, partial [Anaerolineales bacterium]
SAWVGPAVLTAILGVEMLYVFLSSGGGMGMVAASVSPQQVGMALYGPYVLGVEMVSMLLLSGLVGAYHLGREKGG